MIDGSGVDELVAGSMNKGCRNAAADGDDDNNHNDADDDDADDDEGFEYRFAKPPVTPAAIDWALSVRIFAGKGGARPTVEVVAASTFSLPVERGWPRDSLSSADVASSMRDVLADRLPRWAATTCQFELDGAPPQLRGMRGWPELSTEAQPASMRCWLLPAPLPPVLTLCRLSEGQGVAGFALGGLACAGAAAAKLEVVCEPICSIHEGGEERLDLRLTTRLSGMPVAGRAWAMVGCGGHWWFERVRLPLIRSLLEGFHTMVHEQMMVNYVATLAG